MKLSIVDQSPVSADSTPAQALQNSIDLAKLAERLGYERYWIAEHHATRGLASPAPEVMIARVAAETHDIRVGAGAVLLPYYSAMKVAEVFSMLSALYPNRIDLGVGRSQDASAPHTYALRRDRGGVPLGQDMGQQLLELLAFLDHGQGFPDEHPFAGIHLSPDMPEGPDVWMVGASDWSADTAAQLGLPYAFAHFINPELTSRAIETYRQRYSEQNWPDPPRVIVALGALCAETDEEADYLASSLMIRQRLSGTGIAGTGATDPIASPRDAQALLAKLPPLGSVPGPNAPPMRYVGCAGRVHEDLLRTGSAVNADELMIVTITYSHEARMRSYELLAREFGLSERALAAGTRP